MCEHVLLGFHISFVVQFAIVDNRAVLDQPNYYPVYRVRV